MMARLSLAGRRCRNRARVLESRSPLFRADAIRIPMLIAPAANDPRVKQGAFGPDFVGSWRSL
jgi:hypothetical protein